MSLIHDALKKAEQQRQLGTAPTLDSPVMSTRRRRAWWRGPVFALVGALLLVGATWLWWRGTSRPAAEVTATATAPALAPTAAAPAAEAPPLRTTQSRPKPRAPAAVARKPAEPPPVAENKPAAAEPSFIPEPVNPTATRAPQGQPAAGNASVVVPPPAPGGKTAPAANSASALPLYWELPYSERKDLPEFKISMHVYADDPAERFVILNGARHVEGDDLGGDMTLKAIDPTGLVVQRNGKSFRVPRNGGY